MAGLGLQDDTATELTPAQRPPDDKLSIIPLPELHAAHFTVTGRKI